MTVEQLNISNLTAQHGQFRTLPLSFQATSGEIVALVGPSGAGKTSILRRIAGLTSSGEGAFTITNKQGTPKHDAPKPVLCFQESRLLPWRTVEGNAFFGLGHRPKAYERTKARHLLTQLGIDGPYTNPASTLSGGQRRRVAIARTLVTEAPVILIDEPFAHLDATAEDLVIRTITRQSEQGTIVVVAVHSIEESKKIASKHFQVRPAKGAHTTNG